MNTYQIQFKLHNGKHIASGSYIGTLEISSLFNIIKTEYDFFDQLHLEKEWIAFSTETENYVVYDDTTLDEILFGHDSDVFIFQPQGTHGLQLSQWYNTNFKKLSQMAIQQQNPIDDIKLQQINNIMLEACVAYTEEEYAKSIENYLDVLELDEGNANAIAGIGKCLCNMKCHKSAIQLFDLALKQDPENEETKFYKAKSLNLLFQHKEAYSILKSIKTITNQSYFKKELQFTQEKTNQNKQGR